MVAIANLTLAALSSMTPALVERQQATCSNTPACPAENNCLATTENGASFQMQCGTNLNSRILTTIPANSFADCANACSFYDGCTGFNIQGQYCYLVAISSDNGTPAPGVTAGVMTAAPTRSITNSGTCNDPIDCSNRGTVDRCTVRRDDMNFVLSCNMDFFGGDTEYVRTVDMNTCIVLCAEAYYCEAVSWSDGNCWLKQDIYPGIYNPNVIGAYLTY